MTTHGRGFPEVLTSQDLYNNNVTACCHCKWDLQSHTCFDKTGPLNAVLLPHSVLYCLKDLL